MRARLSIVSLTGILLLGSGIVAALGQPPAPLPPSVTPTVPAFLPPSVTGRPGGAITPVAATKAAVPIERFEKNLRAFPPETVACLHSTRAAAAWLTRRNQSDGRFLGGLNPGLARPLEGLDDLNQAYACWGVCRAAKFTGDEKLGACASQAVLALLTLTKADPNDANCRVPIAESARCNRVGLASILLLCIHDLPSPDAKLVAEGEKLAAFLKKQLRTDGSVQYADGAEPATKTDPDGVNTYPGLCFQALLASDRAKPEQWKRDALIAGMKHYREWFKAHPSPMLAGSMLPAACEQYLRTKTAGVADFACEMADHLCACQHLAGEARELRTVGGFRIPGQTEPGSSCAAFAEALACATTLAAQVPDATRHAKYRTACIAALGFARGLQFTEESTLHFEKSFRAEFLLGGVCTSHTNGNIRADQTAMLACAQIRFLESGAEKGE